ncbi:glycerate kinase [Mobilicoccus pelagius]|uniref:Putative glycerate kinase n=1 Tax=Mobilicoccus pelagius NBRC 104925 TaxID=1089455 RepID=H5UQB2_9MICO|nr:glycerate kinase [Mobilicoccus pelagius]GAB47920.1 putative glycerate kinase [Mobilicoccus pelagius NBRC 104925]
MTTDPGHVLVACDKFKGSLTAHEVVEHLEAGLRDGAPGVGVRSVIIADGGDGTLDAAEVAGFEPVPVQCSGPTGEPVETRYARRGDEAVVEMADACGLVRLPGGERRALDASSAGLGEVVAAALDAGVRNLVIGIGGSASTDGGAGMLTALGARFLDSDGVELPPGGGALTRLSSVDLDGLHPALADTRITVACDVDNPLLGERGAAAIFGPQKGASPEHVVHLDAGLARLSSLVEAQTGRHAADLPRAGAAGGVGWATLAVLGATMRPGIEIVLALNDFDEMAKGARLVVTGEGSLDLQTLLGKAPAGVARAAHRAGVPIVAVCGRALLSEEEAREAGFERLYRLTDLEPDEAVCMAEAGPLLRRLAAHVARAELA